MQKGLKRSNNYELIVSLTKSLMKSRYRKTFAGFLWVILNPILTFAVQALIFKNILKVTIPDYYLFLLSGVVPWIYVTSTMNMTVSMFVQNRPNLMAFKLDPWIFIASQTIDNTITFFASFIVLLAMNAEIGILYGFKLPMFLLTSLILGIATFFISFLLATVHAFFRDTQFILQFVLSLAYFVTPIFYPAELIPERYRWVVEYNPLYILIKPFQSIFWRYDLNLYMHDILRAMVFVIIIIFVCLFNWRRKKYELYFRI